MKPIAFRRPRKAFRHDYRRTLADYYIRLATKSLCSPQIGKEEIYSELLLDRDLGAEEVFVLFALASNE